MSYESRLERLVNKLCNVYIVRPSEHTMARYIRVHNTLNRLRGYQ